MTESTTKTTALDTLSAKLAPVAYTPLRELPHAAPYRAGDVLVIFGELFSRGYANGIVDEAERAGLKIIRSTVGRRTTEGALRPLNDDEVAAQPKPFINIPLEAGFDMEPCSQDGTSPVDQIKSVKMSDWAEVKMDWAKVADSRERAHERFRRNVTAYLKELERHIEKGANVIFAHTMAGGVPRAKILMPTMNRVFKGVGDRHVPSATFWSSDLGKFSAQNFDDVTAQTLLDLIELSAPLRERLKKEGGTCRYVAYGYHGTEVMMRNEYAWQSYAPYLQGWAKMKLENVARDAEKHGVQATVYNCPEILTNSSSIFVGVEVPLYPFLGALLRESKGSGKGATKANDIVARCQALLKPEHTVEKMMKFTDETLTSPELRSVCNFASWPDHSNQAQMEKLIAASEELFNMHKDPKQLITFVLSEEIFRATGYLMFHESFNCKTPVYWLGHDVLARALTSGQTL